MRRINAKDEIEETNDEFEDMNDETGEDLIIGMTDEEKVAEKSAKGK